MPDIKLDDIYVIEDDKELDTKLFNDWLTWVNEVEKNSTSRVAVMFYLQKTLNDFIDRKKGVKRDDRREWYTRNVLYAVMEVGETLEELKVKHWTRDRHTDRRKLLEEYIDIWHFLMSAAIDAGWHESIIPRLTKTMEDEWPPKNIPEKNIEAGKLLVEMIECLNRGHRACYLSAVELFVESMAAMGYTFDEFYRAYLIKNFKNFARQESPTFRGGKYL